MYTFVDKLYYMKQFRNSQYYVNQDGVIYNSKTKRYVKPIIKAFSKNNTKRAFVGLYIDGKQTNLFVHRIIAELYLSNPENLPQVNHIDGNPLNNSISNLEWCSQRDNNIHAIKTGLRPTKLNKEIVECIREDLAKKITIREIALKYNVGKTIIFKIKHNQSWNF